MRGKYLVISKPLNSGGKEGTPVYSKPFGINVVGLGQYAKREQGLLTMIIQINPGGAKEGGVFKT